MNRNIFKGVVTSLVLMFSIVSCDRVEDPEPGATSMKEMAGDWYVTTSYKGQEVLGYQLISTYNSAIDNGQELWIDDHAHIWDFKVKSPANAQALTFNGNGLQNQNYNIKVNITNGKILKGAATSSGGNKTDSIVFDAEFSDDPGNTYRIGGYKRTGFAEDEH